ncbi:MAG: phytanoyl-CoA dioxygenase family protein [Myxococcales bacterium]|nr:phytanoyl-CoA dioxygenase family protein [Myxococcales bacterium]
MGYAEDGYLVVPGFLDAGTCARLIARAEAIAAEQAPLGPRSRFTTVEQDRHSDAWFLGSGDEIRCFFEPEAFAADGALVRPAAESLNKIGHALHDLDPVFEEVSYDPRLAALAEELGMADALAIQSMVIFKQPGIGGEVGCHQDAAFLYTDPVTVMGFWIALEDATVANGCLWAERGGHTGPLRQQFRRTAAGSTEIVTVDPTPLPRPETLTPLPVKAGTLVVLHGLLPHWSGANRSSRRRLAYSVHCVAERAAYPAWNWLQRRPERPARRLRR